MGHDTSASRSTALPAVSREDAKDAFLNVSHPLTDLLEVGLRTDDRR